MNFFFLCIFCSPFQNITEFDGQDGCGSNSWHMVDVDLPKDNNNDPNVKLQHLKPWTQYAIFVKAITLQESDKDATGAKSDIIYIRTHPSCKSDHHFWLFYIIIVAQLYKHMNDIK